MGVSVCTLYINVSVCICTLNLHVSVSVCTPNISVSVRLSKLGTLSVSISQYTGYIFIVRVGTINSYVSVSVCSLQSHAQSWRIVENSELVDHL